MLSGKYNRCCIYFVGFHVSNTEIEKLILSRLNGIKSKFLILLRANCEVLQIQLSPWFIVLCSQQQHHRISLENNRLMIFLMG
jgi:hypothetical protein